MRPIQQGATLALLFGVVHMLDFVKGQTDQCRNPLYETHFFGKNDIQTLNNFPTVKTNLRACPAYNQKASCCHQTFEAEQQKYYNFWRRIFEAKMTRVIVYRKSVVDVEQTDDFRLASYADKQQYQQAMDAFAEVLDPSVHSDCLSMVMTYVAGVICFSCKPEWVNFCEVVDEKVIRVRTTSSVCSALWTVCGNFGDAVQRLKLALLDSALAKLGTFHAEEDLDMFFDQEALCDWLHDTVALHPFSAPTEADKASRLNQMLAADTRRLEAGLDPDLDFGKDLRSLLFGNKTTMHARDTQITDVAEAAAEGRRLQFQRRFDAIKEGQASGFDRSWKGFPGLTSSARRWVTPSWLGEHGQGGCALLALALTAAMGGTFSLVF